MMSKRGTKWPPVDGLKKTDIRLKIQCNFSLKKIKLRGHDKRLICIAQQFQFKLRV